jgi:uncharacterized protein YcbK (DUF882 family)
MLEDRGHLHTSGTFVEALRQSGLNRRHFIKVGLLTTIAASLSPAKVVEAIAQDLSPTRRLSFFNTHTAEALEVCYCRDGAYSPKALSRINHIMRDHRSGYIRPIKPRLLDILHTLANRLGPPGPYHIISGYRSPATNAELRKKTRGVARRSFHTMGMAIDIRIPGFSTKGLLAEAVELQAGGVGYYPDSDFIHLDCGPVRHW